MMRLVPLQSPEPLAPTSGAASDGSLTLPRRPASPPIEALTEHAKRVAWGKKWGALNAKTTESLREAGKL